ncbi:CopG family transcriptional regulator [Vitreoscilla massiliensis]|uniref:CopG family transcriptional regulator n=1 Tax=Vitreoscilla massiliensis TaxID=1689272 RepID=A0ABY4DWS5_9NEIS|nr:DUF411 domain-containing protein [Vitreoscilla massiliensis]UOO87967.1 CopG family transcriptional regulator [Vitreoscilla massiliensis]
MQNLFSTWGRRALLAVGLSLLSTSVWAQTWPAATVYKSSTCGCCIEYVKYLRANGMKVSAIDHNNMNALRQQLGTDKVASCHTVKIGAYVVEGHVPVAAIRQMLAQKPNIKGVSLPGMPYNSPGMGPEKKGSLKILSIGRAGQVQGVYMVL